MQTFFRLVTHPSSVGGGMDCVTSLKDICVGGWALLKEFKGIYAERVII